VILHNNKFILNFFDHLYHHERVIQKVEKWRIQIQSNLDYS